MTSRPDGYQDGPVAQAQFNAPADICFDGSNNLLIADAGNWRIRKISPEGIVSTIAGGDNDLFATNDGFGPDARFNDPHGICWHNGNIFVAEAHHIRKIAPNGYVSTICQIGGDTIRADHRGNLVVVSFVKSTLTLVNPDKGKLFRIKLQEPPIGLYVEETGNVLFTGGKVHRICIGGSEKPSNIFQILLEETNLKSGQTTEKNK